MEVCDQIRLTSAEARFCFDINILSSICLIEETMESKMKEIIVKVELVELVELVGSLKM